MLLLRFFKLTCSFFSVVIFISTCEKEKTLVTDNCNYTEKKSNLSIILSAGKIAVMTIF